MGLVVFAPCGDCISARSPPAADRHLSGFREGGDVGDLGIGEGGRHGRAAAPRLRGACESGESLETVGGLRGVPPARSH